MQLETFIAHYPRLYHMAEAGTWPSIKQHGLLSTLAVLDRYGIAGPQRLVLEAQHRPSKVTVGPLGNAIVLRDQIPMPPKRLEDALIDGTTPSQWYKLINSKVFMWAEEHRLFKLLNARSYKRLTHDVLTIDTASLVRDYAEKIMVCRMNSGNTFPMPHARGLEDFMSISDYPVKPRSGAPVKKVVEVVTDYSIPNIKDYVIEVRSIQGQTVLGHIGV
ncbi:hypothetical protein JFT81_01590 [Pseudomonas sp. TH43]|uniref:DUF7002 family protein n=1 Tax=Pseudomonas TaxID=286 RepID=UPI001240C940|nr:MULTISPECIES: hypothetical protein [Pseudomonas]MBK5373326.1 hypothetical protein [Pseudomonas sp. TH43]MCQ9390185.1 hypothetical protein [Pseudomonas viridiflava]VVO95798.1 hypothetical protein PS865_02583 [Pseudomonas fluorescens]